jgi:hypothetical protein
MLLGILLNAMLVPLFRATSLASLSASSFPYMYHYVGLYPRENYLPFICVALQAGYPLPDLFDQLGMVVNVMKQIKCNPTVSEYGSCAWVDYFVVHRFNTLNAELHPTCHFLALSGAHHIFHISRIRVNCLQSFNYGLLVRASVIQF